MVIIAWLTTLLFSSPQAVIFRVMKHPVADFYQVTVRIFLKVFNTEVRSVTAVSGNIRHARSATNF